MPTYQAEILNKNGAVIRTETFDAFNDIEAFSYANKLAPDREIRLKALGRDISDIKPK